MWPFSEPPIISVFCVHPSCGSPFIRHREDPPGPFPTHRHTDTDTHTQTPN